MTTPVHPMLVHFPAVLVPAAALLTIAARKREGLRDASAIVTHLATLSALVAVAAGLFDHEPYEHGPLGSVIEAHERLGFVTLFLVLSASALRSIGRQRGNDPVAKPWLAALLVAATVALLAAGRGGASLVYDEAVGVRGGAHVRGADAIHR